MILNKFHFILLFLLSTALVGLAQDNPDFEFSYEVNKVYPYVAITDLQLQQANNVVDLNKHFKSFWIDEYISVDVTAQKNGQSKTLSGKNDEFTKEQKELMSNADIGSDIMVAVHYLPENTLKHNEPKDFSFSFFIEPEKQAEFFGGDQQLEKYLKLSVIDKLPEGSFKKYNLSAVTFTIGEQGQILNSRLFWPSENEEVDKLLMETICNMPNWKPAEYSNGLKREQEMAFILGDKESCVINMLNIAEVLEKLN